MKIEEKEICQELNVTEKACSMAMYLFLRTIFSKRRIQRYGDRRISMDR